ncbi:MAG TPA: hypothetical protein VGS12_11025 [Caulobacteraceae bacterium]|nr:hypothetical protein [Caulobacteraceae bacterium]
MTTAASVRAAPARAVFAPYHRWDRNFFLTYVVLFWVGVLMGFTPEIVHRAQHHEVYPAIVYAHGVAFVGWLVLLTAQVLLIRTRRQATHRKLGVAGMALAGLMVVLGPAAAIAAQRLEMGTADADPAFLSVQLLDIVGFAALAGAAFALRREPAAHKRLILLATLCIIDAGFARWWGGAIHKRLGDGVGPFFAQIYLANFLLILGIGAYDLATRRRLHPAYAVGAVWALVVLTTASWLYYYPPWKAFAVGLIGR